MAVVGVGDQGLQGGLAHAVREAGGGDPEAGGVGVGLDLREGQGDGDVEAVAAVGFCQRVSGVERQVGAPELPLLAEFAPCAPFGALRAEEAHGEGVAVEVLVEEGPEVAAGGEVADGVEGLADGVAGSGGVPEMVEGGDGFVEGQPAEGEVEGDAVELAAGGGQHPDGAHDDLFEPEEDGGGGVVAFGEGVLEVVEVEDVGGVVEGVEEAVGGLGEFLVAQKAGEGGAEGVGVADAGEVGVEDAAGGGGGEVGAEGGFADFSFADAGAALDAVELAGDDGEAVLAGEEAGDFGEVGGAAGEEAAHGLDAVVGGAGEEGGGGGWGGGVVPQLLEALPDVVEALDDFGDGSGAAAGYFGFVAVVEEGQDGGGELVGRGVGQTGEGGVGGEDAGDEEGQREGVFGAEDAGYPDGGGNRFGEDAVEDCGGVERLGEEAVAGVELVGGKEDCGVGKLDGLLEGDGEVVPDVVVVAGFLGGGFFLAFVEDEGDEEASDARDQGG